MSQQNSTSWDLGRFVKTLAYFGVIPFLSSIDWFQQMLGSRPDPKLNSAALANDVASSPAQDVAQQTGMVLVVGAGRVEERVVQRLLERGYGVRSLVQNLTAAQALFGNSVGNTLELVQGDVTQPGTITAGLMANVRAVITSMGDSPGQGETLGIQHLVQVAANSFQATPTRNGKLIFDFRNPTQDVKESWGALDDVVMGGVSESNIRLVDGAALFSGKVSTANSGGFASVRTRNFDPPLDLTGYDGIELRVKGDGQRYKFMIRSATQWDSVAYCYSFDTLANTWITVRVPFAELLPVFRAKTVPNSPPLNTQQVHAFQLMLSKFEYDGALNPKFAPGFFQLQVESIQAYRGTPLPQLILISNPGVNRSLILETEESIRQSGIPYTIIRPAALTEAPGGQPLIFSQGETLQGSVSQEDIAELAVQVLEIPQANRTVEVAAAAGGYLSEDWAKAIAQLAPDPTP
ncbi:MAG: CIA30 family protein [Leptolyngbyaceae bacterium]|nr:CIA30 family protein [Leptolyngbyaceae bacterium]